MGYYTWYIFKTKNNIHKICDIVSFMREKSDDSYVCYYPFTSQLDSIFEEDCHMIEDFEMEPDEDCKWYDHDKEMLELSEKFRETIFVLEGEGEERGDYWRTYYQNGMCQYCLGEIVYEDFNELKLKRKLVG